MSSSPVWSTRASFKTGSKATQRNPVSRKTKQNKQTTKQPRNIKGSCTFSVWSRTTEEQWGVGPWGWRKNTSETTKKMFLDVCKDPKCG